MGTIGKITSNGWEFSILYEDNDGYGRYINLHPDTETEYLRVGMEVLFEIDSDGLAKITWSPTLYSEIETTIIRWNIDGTKTAGSLTREILGIIKRDERI